APLDDGLDVRQATKQRCAFDRGLHGRLMSPFCRLGFARPGLKIGPYSLTRDSAWASRNHGIRPETGDKLRPLLLAASAHHGHSAVHMQRLARDVTGLPAREIGDCGADIL